MRGCNQPVIYPPEYVSTFRDAVDICEKIRKIPYAEMEEM